MNSLLVSIHRDDYRYKSMISNLWQTLLSSQFIPYYLAHKTLATSYGTSYYIEMIIKEAVCDDNNGDLNEKPLELWQQHLYPSTLKLLISTVVVNVSMYQLLMIY